MEIDFKHRQSAHCESGVTANLVSHYGEAMSEAMAFGIGAGFFFAYLPMIKLNDLPLTTFRCATGSILKRTMKSLNIQAGIQRFRDPELAMAALDETIAKGIPVGLQTGAWWLPYFPPAYRFHFNMHNLVVYGRRGDEYLISDPVFPEPVVCGRADLMRARFAKGTLAPKGKMYFVNGFPDRVEIGPAIRKGMKSVSAYMLNIPFPIIGIRGMRFLADRLERWPRKLGEEKALLYLGQLVRMQEEIGTGGAGFRFIYAAFLQEAGALLQDDRFLELSATMTPSATPGANLRWWRPLPVKGARKQTTLTEPWRISSGIAPRGKKQCTVSWPFFRGNFKPAKPKLNVLMFFRCTGGMNHMQ